MTEQSDDHGPDVILLLKQEHDEVARELESLIQTQDRVQFRKKLEQLATQLSRHEIAEEIAVYPVVVELQGGLELRSEALEQERITKSLLTKSLRRNFWSPRGHGTRRLIRQLIKRVAAHAKFEEEQIFPLIERSEGDQKRQMMGAWVANAESVAPTRPHPHAPQRLPGLVASGPILAIMDRLRDFARRKIEDD